MYSQIRLRKWLQHLPAKLIIRFPKLKEVNHLKVVEVASLNIVHAVVMVVANHVQVAVIVVAIEAEIALLVQQQVTVAAKNPGAIVIWGTEAVGLQVVANAVNVVVSAEVAEALATKVEAGLHTKDDKHNNIK